jgi:hypothetical protein
MQNSKCKMQTVRVIRNEVKVAAILALVLRANGICILNFEF